MILRDIKIEVLKKDLKFEEACKKFGYTKQNVYRHIKNNNVAFIEKFVEFVRNYEG